MPDLDEDQIFHRFADDRKKIKILYLDLGSKKFQEACSRRRSATAYSPYRAPGFDKTIPLLVEHSIPSTTKPLRQLTMSNMKAIKRLMKELKQVEKDPVPYVSAAPLDEDNPFLWRALFSGVKGTPLEGVAIAVDLTFPPDYPVKPPNAGVVGVGLLSSFLYLSVRPHVLTGIPVKPPPSPLRLHSVHPLQHGRLLDQRQGTAGALSEHPRRRSDVPR
jgi:hypothetical protein